MQTPVGIFLIAAGIPFCEWLLLKLFRLPRPTRWQQAVITAITIAEGMLWFGYKEGWESLRPSLANLPADLATLVAFVAVGWALFHMPYTPREYQADRTRRP